MKFEDEIKKCIDMMVEDVVPGAPVPGAPVPNNAGQVAPQGDQMVNGSGEVTADQLMQFALNSDPKQLQTLGIDSASSGDDLFKAVHAAFVKGSGQGSTTGTTGTSSVNTAGVPAL